MLLPSQPLPLVPDDTARIARAAFRRGNPYVLLRDKLGTVFADADSADLYPKFGQPAYAPWRLALVTLMRSREGLSDRQAADAVRGRIDWKYLLALDLADAGFGFSVLCEFRGRLLQHGATGRLLGRLLDAAREDGLLKARGRQRTDSTHVLAAVRTLNRLELVGEALRAALNALAVAAPGRLRAVAPPEWHDRCDRRIEDMRLPDTLPKRDAHAAQVGADGFVLLDALDGVEAPRDARELPEVAVLRRVWARHFERVERRQGMVAERASARGCGRCRAADPVTGWSRPTTPKPGSGPSTRRDGPASWSISRKPATRTCRASWPMPTPRRPTCMRRRARDRSTTHLLQRAWLRPSTWWTPPMSAPTTSSPPARSTGSTQSVPATPT